MSTVTPDGSPELAGAPSYEEALAREREAIRILHDEMGHPEVTIDVPHVNVMAAVEDVERTNPEVSVYQLALARVRQRIGGAANNANTTQIIPIV